MSKNIGIAFARTTQTVPCRWEKLHPVTVGGYVRVRIRETPREREIDGIRLDNLRPGTVRLVSASIGAWLIAEGYADPEMRANSNGDEEASFSGLRDVRSTARDGPRRRRDD
jgi:hypothetical protein